MNSKTVQLKPQDILVLLRLLLWKEAVPWKFAPLAAELKLSQSETHQAIKRAQICDLYDPLTRKPKRSSLAEFLIYGLRHVFPAIIGVRSKGILTAHSAPPLSSKIIAANQDKFVWPYKKGKENGLSITPLYPTVPEISLHHPELYSLLALLDALRVGKAREREMAKEEILKRILSE